MFQPRVTIGLITYNGSAHIRRALDSLLSQTFRDFELVISDNASTDATPEICQEYAARDYRVRYIRQEKNLGAAGNLFFVPHVAYGEYFMWASDDDWWNRAFVEKLVSALDNNPGYGVAMSSYDLVDTEGKLIKRVLFSGELDLVGQDHKAVFRKMLFDQPIHVCVYGLFRRNFLLELLRRGIPKCVRHDRVLMAETALATRFYTIPPVLFFKVRDIPLPERERYHNDPMAKSVKDPLARSKYYATLLFWLLTSKLIPWRRKLIVPTLWLRVVWLRKRRIMGELGSTLAGLLNL